MTCTMASLNRTQSPNKQVYPNPVLALVILEGTRSNTAERNEYCGARTDGGVGQTVSNRGT